jgi:hypothetical protein
MAAQGSASGSGRRKVLILVMFALVGVLVLQLGGLSLPELPTRAAIEEEGEALALARSRLDKLTRRSARQDKEVAELNVLASPFWRTSESSADRETQVVRSALDRLASRAKVSAPRIVSQGRIPLQGHEYIHAIELSVDWTVMMKEVTRLLNEIEKSDQIFQWTECTIRPNNVRDPKEVRVLGRVRALVLNQEAQSLLAASEGGKR